jgi:RNA polymerase sigma factor FliA
MYTQDGTIEAINIEQHLVQYAPLVKRLAHQMMVKLPASVQVGDIIQAGMIGLLDAIQRYEESQGAQFETYAVQRIRGAMLDELRSGDFLPRSLRKNLRTIEKAISKLEQRLGRPPVEQEIAREMSLTLTDYQQMLQEARGYQVVHYDDFKDAEDDHFLERHGKDESPGLLENMIDAEMRQALIVAIDDLPEREKTVMGLYYEQELNLREIGEVMGVSESRICQLHSQAVARLRGRLHQ